MTVQESQQLAEFIKDHDKRFEAKAKTNDDDSAVQLTLASDGTALEPIRQIDQYRMKYIDRDDPGPTVRAAWNTWLTGLTQDSDGYAD